MNKTKIEYVDYTWSPVTGCLHGCEYCYARRIAERFKGWTDNDGWTHDDVILQPEEPLRVLDKPLYIAYEDTKGKFPQAPYPFGFKPTFYRYRLNEPAKLKKPSRIFVCSMADLFGDWVPDEWIEQVFAACEAAPQHTYMFLTKSPYRYIDLLRNGILRDQANFWYGTTCTTSRQAAFCTKQGEHFKTFISIEPILKRWRPNTSTFKPLQWVIIGAETGNRKGKVIPRKEWIDDIVAWCRRDNVPVFMKDSLIPIVGEGNMLREFPRESVLERGNNND